MKRRLAARLGPHLLQPLGRDRDQLRRNRGVREKQQGFLVRRIPGQHGCRRFLRLLHLAQRHLSESQLDRDLGVLRILFGRFQQESIRRNRSTLLMQHEACLPDGPGIHRFQPKHVQIFDLCLLVIAGFEIAIRPLQMPRLLRIRRAPRQQHRHHHRREQRDTNLFQFIHVLLHFRWVKDRRLGCYRRIRRITQGTIGRQNDLPRRAPRRRVADIDSERFNLKAEHGLVSVCC